MKIILYPCVNPDRHGLIGKVIEVTSEKGCRLVANGMAMAVEYDQLSTKRPVARVVAEHLRRDVELEDDETKLETELDDKDDDDGEDEYQEETDEEV